MLARCASQSCLTLRRAQTKPLWVGVDWIRAKRATCAVRAIVCADEERIRGEQRGLDPEAGIAPRAPAVGDEGGVGERLVRERRAHVAAVEHVLDGAASEEQHP